MTAAPWGAPRDAGDGKRSTTGTAAWHGTLDLRYLRRDGRTVVRDRHTGPLRVLKSLYPEGEAICHNVLVHPPGGMVGGDSLAIDIAVEPAAHALLTTPGATRFYRTTGAAAAQEVRAVVAAAARLEWLPLETIAYSGCVAENRARFELEAGAEMIGWDVTALGLPASQRPFDGGRFEQRIEIAGCWLDRGDIRADDRRLLDSPLGFNGRRVLATSWFAAGRTLDDERRDALLDVARSAARQHALNACAGATAPQPNVVVLRVLADRVEPAMDLLRRTWAGWRRAAWQLDAAWPRVWLT